jgi:hypothetical protein
MKQNVIDLNVIDQNVIDQNVIDQNEPNETKMNVFFYLHGKTHGNNESINESI